MIPDLSTSASTVFGDAEHHLVKIDRLLDVAIAQHPMLALVANDWHRPDAPRTRLVPWLGVVTAMKIGAPVDEGVIKGAACFELLRRALEVHCAVRDEAQWVDNEILHETTSVAILVGDYLLSRASAVAAELGSDVEILMSATLSEVAGAAIRERHQAYDLRRSEAAYLDAIRSKAGAICAASAQLPARIADPDQPLVTALASYGRRIGMAIQISQDVFSILAPENPRDPCVGRELTQGIYTLPVIYALEDHVHGPELAALLGSQRLAMDELDSARDLVGATDAIERAMEVASGYRNAAVEDLAAHVGTDESDLDGISSLLDFFFGPVDDVLSGRRDRPVLIGEK